MGHAKERRAAKAAAKATAEGQQEQLIKGVDRLDKSIQGLTRNIQVNSHKQDVLLVAVTILLSKVFLT